MVFHRLPSLSSACMCVRTCVCVCKCVSKCNTVYIYMCVYVCACLKSVLPYKGMTFYLYCS